MKSQMISREAKQEEVCCFKRMLYAKYHQYDNEYKLNVGKIRYNSILSRYQQYYTCLAGKLHYNCNFITINTSPTLANSMIIAATLLLTLVPINCITSPTSGSSSLDYPTAQFLSKHQSQVASLHMPQARAGGLEPGDYVDEAGELEVLANQPQIPTAQLMSAAGHVVPQHFFLPGGSIPALYSRYQHPQSHQHQQQQQQIQLQQFQQQLQQQLQLQQQQSESMQQMGSQVQARHIAPVKYVRQADLIAAASAAAISPVDQHDSSTLIDFNGYNLVASQQEARDAGAQAVSPGQQDLAEFLGPAGQSAALYEQQQQHYAEQQIAAELAAIAVNQQQQQNLDNSAQSSENSLVGPDQYAASGTAPSSMGPPYQISNQHSQESYGFGGYDNNKEVGQKPFGQPTKSSSKEPSGMLKPLGNPKTISSPVIDFVANQLPKTSNLEKFTDKLPSVQTPTVFSFSSSKDPIEKVKNVNQKKRNVMRQAEQIAKLMIKSVNDKFGTNIGDQTDIPFLLSSLGPLGFAQNVLFDPTLLITLLNSAEKTYFSDVLPGPAKMALQPVLNIFRVPNKKRDKANLTNILSFLASGGQTPSSIQSKHRQEKAKNKNRK